MNSPTTAVLWETWKQYRGLLIAATAWLLAMLGLIHTLSGGLIFGMELLVAKDTIVIMLAMAIGPLMVGLFLMFAYSGDITGRDSTFPSRMFTLPLTARALAGWPMLYGTVAIALTWLAVASLVLRPAGVDVALWWPAVFLASCLVWVQTLSWRPFALPGLRLVAAIVPIGVLVAIFGLCLMAHLPEPVIAMLLGCTIPPAYVVAVAGVARARRGDQPEWQWLDSCVRKIAEWFSLRGRGFASWSCAQVWFEWRRGGLGLPVTAGLAILFWAILIAVARHNIPLLSPHNPLRSPIILLAIPLFVSMWAGAGLGVCGAPRRGKPFPQISPFLATRPMTCAGLIWAKMKAAAISMIVTWGMTLAAVVLMFLLTASWSELAGQWNMLSKDLSAVQKAAIITLGPVFLLAATWRLAISDMFLGLAGRNWVGVIWAFVITPLLIGPVLIGCKLTEHPEYHADLLAALPWAVGLAAALKLLLGAWLVRVVMRRRLIEAWLMKRLLGAWLLTAAVLAGLLCWLIPAGLASWHLIIAGVVLVVPLVRISLAPIALAWNRHR